MVFLNKLIEKKSGWVISQYSLVQESPKQPDIVPWVESDFLTIILISECLIIISILDLKKKEASFVIFLSLDFQNFSFFFFFPFPLGSCSLAWRKSLQRSRPLLLESSPTSDPPTFS